MPRLKISSAPTPPKRISGRLRHRPPDFQNPSHPLHRLLERLHAAGERDADVSRCPKPGAGHHGDTTLDEQQLSELVVIAAAAPRNDTGALCKVIDRPDTRPATDAGL